MFIKYGRFVLFTAALIPASALGINRAGDANNDHVIDFQDAVLVQSRLYGTLTVWDVSPLALVDGDGTLGLKDMLIVAQLSAGARSGVQPVMGLISIMAGPSETFPSELAPPPVIQFEIESNSLSARKVDGMDSLLWAITGQAGSLANSSVSVSGTFASTQLLPINVFPFTDWVRIDLVIPIHDSDGALADWAGSGQWYYVLPPSCGDGGLQMAEVCDEGILNGTCGHCDLNCTGTYNLCGDGTARCGEECDDGNATNGDGCDGSCQFEPMTCGNGAVEGPHLLSATLEWISDGCTYPSHVEVRVNGGLLFDREMPSWACGCNTPVQSVTTTNPESLRLFQSGLNTLNLLINPSGAGGLLGWAILTVTSDMGSWETVLFDGGDLAHAAARVTDWCPYTMTDSLDVTTGLQLEIGERCDDGPGGGCLDDCSSTRFKQISAGAFHTCGIKSDDSLACWGAGFSSGWPSGAFLSVSSGAYHSCAIRNDNTVHCWGNDTYGQASPPAGAFLSVSAGAWFTCGLKTDSTLACWGSNDGPTGTFEGQSLPPSGPFAAVSCGGWHACALKLDDTLECWGAGTTVGSFPDLGQAMPPAGSYKEVSSGRFFTCAIRSDDTVQCWLVGLYGETNPPPGIFLSISSGMMHVCGVLSDSTLDCWGDNARGQSAPPTDLFWAVTSGARHTCGLRSDFGVDCWGDNLDEFNNWGGQSSPP